MGKMGRGDVTRWVHAAASLRCPDPEGDFSLMSQISELCRRLVLCLRFFLLRTPSMRCHRSPFSSFVADRNERAG